MKKTIINALLLLSLSAAITSCETAKKEAPLDKQDTTKKIEQESNDKGNEHSEVAHAVYQCPMKCEEDKTYEAPGTCPVCKMDLKEVVAPEVEASKEEAEPVE